MNNIYKILFIAGAALAILYYKAYDAFRSLIFEYDKLTLEHLSNEDAEVGIWIDVTNNGNQNVFIEKINLKVYANNNYIGTLENPTKQVIPSKSSNSIFLVLPLKYSSIFEELKYLFSNFDSSKIKIYIQGSIWFQGVAIPIPNIEIYEEDFKQIMMNDVSKVLTDFVNKEIPKMGNSIDHYNTFVI